MLSVLKLGLQDFSAMWCCQSGHLCRLGNDLTGAKAYGRAKESSQSALREEAAAPGQATRTRRAWSESAEEGGAAPLQLRSRRERQGAPLPASSRAAEPLGPQPAPTASVSTTRVPRDRG